MAALVAQWIRHRSPKPGIVGSSPTEGNLFQFFHTEILNIAIFSKNNHLFTMKYNKYL